MPLLVASSASGGDCTFNPVAQRTPREIWRDASVRAETVAPTESSKRRRSVDPPAAAAPPLSPVNFIDAEVFGKMQRDGVLWTGLSSDEEFFRRVSLDLTGTIPGADAVKAFLADARADKRVKAIDALLASNDYPAKWAMWLGDLVQNVYTPHDPRIAPQSRNAYHAWMLDSFRTNKPYDQMVREQIAGKGTGFTNPEVNFWVRQIANNAPAQDTFDNVAAATGEKFLGLPLNCISCHDGRGHLELVNTGLSKRSRYEFWQNAAFFSQVTAVANRAEIGSEYTISDNTVGAYRLTTISGNKTPRQPAPGESMIVEPAFFLTGEKPNGGETRRQAYGRMLTAHPQFARATVNRVWKEIFGIGLVEPLDGFDLTKLESQPTHPALLEKLAESFVASGYDFRALLKTITVSNTYQLSSRFTSGAWNEAWTPYYARHYPRRLMSEEILDAIFKATNVYEPLPVLSGPSVARAMSLPDPTEGGKFLPFLEAFDRGDREEDARTSDTSIIQALLLLNDRVVADRVKAGNASSNLGKLLAATKDPAEIVEALYLHTLSRHPTPAEKEEGVADLQSGELAKKAEDLQFALINKIEFLFN